MRALAKINLALHVGPLQPDGYHPVDTLCVFAAAGDEVHIEGQADDFILNIVTPDGQIVRGGEDNLVLRAARLLAKCADVPPMRLRLEKSVPEASGIGGGTSNGVATLKLLNRHASSPLSASSLMSLSERLGADGPVCMAPLISRGDSFRGRGIGHQIDAGPALPPLWVCLANPRQAVPTGKVFRAFDRAPPPADLSLPRLPGRFSIADVAEFLRASRNDLRGPAVEICPSIARLESVMMTFPGAVAARMSGSGATVYGLFTSAAAARRARNRLRSKGAWTVSSGLHQIRDAQ